MTKEELGAELARMRLESGKTQTQIAAEIGTKQVTVSAWESGRNEPNLEWIKRYAQACGRTPVLEFRPSEGNRYPAGDNRYHQIHLSEEDHARLDAVATALTIVEGLARDLLLSQLDGIAEATRRSTGTHRLHQR